MGNIKGDRKTGIWIDKQKAVVISLSDSSQNSKTIYSEMETRERVEGEGRSSGRFGEQHLDQEKSKEHRLNEQSKSFIQTILLELRSTDAIVIFGPANMKNVLEKEIKTDQKLNSILKGVEKADSMTENQLIAWVKKYFGLRH